MTDGYKLNNGMFLAISKTTMKILAKRGAVDTLLQSNKAALHRCQCLLDFSCFDKPKSGENIGEKLDEVHRAVGCYADYIGSHTVDGASNARKSVECLEWETMDGRSQTIVAQPCDAHNGNMSASIGSGTSGQVTNLNPDMSAALKCLHNNLTNIVNYKSCKNVLENVQSEHGRAKTGTIQCRCQTRWESYRDEARCGSINQHDLDIAIKRMKSPGGVYETLNTDDEDPPGVVSEEQWNLIQQYEGGMDAIYRFIKFTQHSKVIAHEELFEARSAIEALTTPYFTMWENVSKMRGVKDITVS